MQITPNSVDFRDLATACAAATTSDETVAASLPALLELSGGTSGLLVRGRLDVSVVAARRGDPLDESVVGPLLEAAQPDRWTGGDVPAAWSESGVSELLFRRLPGHAGVIVLTRVGEPFPEWAESLDVATSFVEVAVARRQAEEQFADLTLRVNNAQQLADMGDYDWHIPSDTNRWSDQLFRIYGHEPQSFNATYERFLSLLHPDDRDRIMAVHQAAYGSGEPYQMIERIIRPDGEVRYLSSNGQVIMDAEGAPVRMRGTCIDITDTVLAEQEREHSAERFRALVESSPDAILVLDRGTIVQANGRADELLGGDPVGHRMDEITTLDVEPALGVDGREPRRPTARARHQHRPAEPGRRRGPRGGLPARLHPPPRERGTGRWDARGRGAAAPGDRDQRQCGPGTGRSHVLSGVRPGSRRRGLRPAHPVSSSENDE